MAVLAAEGIDPEMNARIRKTMDSLDDVQGKTKIDTIRIKAARLCLAGLLNFVQATKAERILCAKEVAPYLRPRLRSIDISTGDAPMSVKVIQNL